MTTVDVSRWLQRPRKHYSGARLQQGRPTLDSDFNEDRVDAAADFRRAMLDVVGARAAIDDGFLPDLAVGDVKQAKTVRFGEVVESAVLDYDLKAGSMFVGGRRFEQVAIEPVVFQREFLQNGPKTAPVAKSGTYRQLNILRGWEQCVSVVEDGELQEPAMQGADGGLRARAMRQVEVYDVDAENCADAFAEVVSEFTDDGSASFEPDTGELRSNARLQMTFVSGQDEQCPPCAPTLGGKYLGNEDHTIRVMLTSSDTYVWAYDDAAPLYRAKIVINASGGVSIELLTPPKDAFHQPTANTVVELLPWSVLLENGAAVAPSAKGKGKSVSRSFRNEKLAVRLGVFGEVDQSYDPASRELHAQLGAAALQQLGIGQVSGSSGKSSSKTQASSPTPASSKGQVSPQPSGKGQSSGGQAGKGHSPSEAQPQSKAGVSGTGSHAKVPSNDVDVVSLRWDPSHPFAQELNPSDDAVEDYSGHVYVRFWHRAAPGSPLHVPTDAGTPLGRTGLLPVFSGKGRPGDYWIVSARRARPEQLLPLAVMDASGIPPVGPVEVLSAVSLVTWRAIDSAHHEVVAHRDCRPRLPKLTDRGCCTLVVSADGEGDHQTIQAAIDDLPITGGTICVRPGVYVEELHIAGRSDVLIEGCGPQTIVRSSSQPAADALVRIDLNEGEGNVGLRQLTLEVDGQLGIVARGERLHFEELAITTSVAGGTNRSALVIDDGRNADVRHCRITMAGAFTHDAAVCLGSSGLGLCFEDNVVTTLAVEELGGAQAWGGVQVLGGARGVRLQNNRISGGRGHAITLGSVSFRAVNGEQLRRPGAGLGISGDAPPFLLSASLQSVFVDDREFFAEPDPAIIALELRANAIRNARGSGVAAPALLVAHDEVAMAPPLCHRRRRFRLDDSTIDDNWIEACCDGRTSDDATILGGIVLSRADGVCVRRNEIAGNGKQQELAVSGILVAFGRAVRIEGNRVVGNGAGGALSRPRGGAIVASALFDAGDGAELPPGQAAFVLRRRAVAGEFVEGLRVDGNFVEHVAGPAIRVAAYGACSVTNNHFTVTDAGAASGTTAQAVFILHVSRLAEAVEIPSGEPHPARWVQAEDSERVLAMNARRTPPGPGGGVIFSNNLVGMLLGDGGPRGNGVVAALLSTSSITMSGNHFMARVAGEKLAAHVLAVAACVNASNNRISEGVESTELSLACLGAILTACAGNTSTHCQVVHGLNNHQDPKYFVDEDNLEWLRPQRGCGGAAKIAGELLTSLAQALLGLEALGYAGALAIERES